MTDAAEGTDAVRVQAEERQFATSMPLPGGTASLVTPEDHAALIAESAMMLCGATAALAVRLRQETAEGDEGLLLLDGSVHVPPEALRLVRQIPLAADDPMAEAVRTRRPVMLQTRERAQVRFPHLVPLMEAADAQALVVVPVRHMTTAQGALGLLFREPRTFTPSERARLRAAGARYADAIHQARLYYAERDARTRAETERATAMRALDELVASHDELKSRVRNRTNELARTNAELVAALDKRKRDDEERRVLRLQLASAEEDERRRIARELHDQLGQHLTALRLGIDEIDRLLHTPGRARERLAALQELAGAMTRDVRNLALDLRPPELDDVGLESALETYVHEWSQRFGITAELAFSGRATPLPAAIGTTLYRIVQEALTNVVKHAKASAVGLVVERTDVDVRLIIDDDGVGFDMPTTQSRVRAERRLGLAGMRERAMVVGGTLTVESSPGRGTTVYVCLPLSASIDPS